MIEMVISTKVQKVDSFYELVLAMSSAEIIYEKRSTRREFISRDIESTILPFFMQTFEINSYEKWVSDSPISCWASLEKAISWIKFCIRRSL